MEICFCLIGMLKKWSYKGILFQRKRQENFDMESFKRWWKPRCLEEKGHNHKVWLTGEKRIFEWLYICLLRYKVKCQIGDIHDTHKAAMEINRVVRRKDRKPLLKELSVEVGMEHQEGTTEQGKYLLSFKWMGPKNAGRRVPTMSQGKIIKRKHFI